MKLAKGNLTQRKQIENDIPQEQSDISENAFNWNKQPKIKIENLIENSSIQSREITNDKLFKKALTISKNTDTSVQSPFDHIDKESEIFSCTSKTKAWLI